MVGEGVVAAEAAGGPDGAGITLAEQNTPHLGWEGCGGGWGVVRVWWL